jgi:L-rhamnose isomerase/sugar isomerase
MIDQSHNLKGKIEETIQTVMAAQEIYAKAALVDHKKLIEYASKSDLIRGEQCLKNAFSSDVRPAIAEWRKTKGLPTDPLEAFWQSGYMERIARERAEKNASAVSSYA